tara:strand:- start:512 stop:742 length:231 start_codon:yes stop_codon:yes gene_type:complete
LNISSKGEPGGNWNGKGLERVLIVCVVEMFTTEGISFSAKSANESGAFFALPSTFKTKKKIVKYKKNLLNFDLITF